VVWAAGSAADLGAEGGTGRWGKERRTQRPPGDLTGRIGHALYEKRQADVEKQLERKRREIEREQEEIKAATPALPVAYDTFDDADVIDYTGNYHGTPTY
jgi:hypothetical protein